MARRFNPGGDLDRDYVRIILQNAVAAYPFQIAACFAREADDGNFQSIAQGGQAAVDTSRHVVGIPSTSDVFRASSGDTAGTFRSANTIGALVDQKWYVGVGRFVSATSRQSQRTGAALVSNSQSATLNDLTDLFVARKSLTAFESFPGWLQWVAFWRTTHNDQTLTEICENWVDPRRFTPELLVAYVDLTERKAVVHSPRPNLVSQIVGDPAFTTYAPYTIPLKRRRIFVPTAGGVTGDLASTEGPDTAAIAGEVDVIGDLSVTEAADVAAITGEVTVQGDLSVTEAADVAAIAGEVDISGDLSAEDLQDTAAIDGSVLVQGDLSVTEAADVAAIAGAIEIQGDALITEQSDIAAIAGEVALSGDLAATEQPDLAAVDGSVLVQGDLVSAEDSDVAAIDGSVLVQGDLAATEEPDVAAVNGSNVIIGAMAVTEEPDAAAITGVVIIEGTLSVTEGIDTAAAAGEVDISGDLSVTEAADTLAASGTVEQPITPIIGTMDVTEAADTLAASGTVEQPIAPVVGTMAAIDGSDTAAISGVLQRFGTMAATEGRDVASVIGAVPQVTGDPLPQFDLPYATTEALRFGIPSGPYRNITRRPVGSKAGYANVDFVESVETAPPHSVVPGQD